MAEFLCGKWRNIQPGWNRIIVTIVFGGYLRLEMDWFAPFWATRCYTITVPECPWMCPQPFFGSIPYLYFLVVKYQIFNDFHIFPSGFVQGGHTSKLPSKLLANYFLSLVSFEMLFCSYHLDPILDLHENFFISSGPADFRLRRPPRRFIPVVELVPGIVFG